jgi:hypothetical protein
MSLCTLFPPALRTLIQHTPPGVSPAISRTWPFLGGLKWKRHLSYQASSFEVPLHLCYCCTCVCLSSLPPSLVFVSSLPSLCLSLISPYLLIIADVNRCFSSTILIYLYLLDHRALTAARGGRELILRWCCLHPALSSVCYCGKFHTICWALLGCWILNCISIASTE